MLTCNLPKTVHHAGSDNEQWHHATMTFVKSNFLLLFLRIGQMIRWRNLTVCSFLHTLYNLDYRDLARFGPDQNLWYWYCLLSLATREWCGGGDSEVFVMRRFHEVTWIPSARLHLVVGGDSVTLMTKRPHYSTHRTVTESECRCTACTVQQYVHPVWGKRLRTLPSHPSVSEPRGFSTCINWLNRSFLSVFSFERYPILC